MKHREAKQFIVQLQKKKNAQIKKIKCQEKIKQSVKKVVHSNQQKDYFLELLQTKQSILILGDGNLSFSVAVKDMVPGLIYPTVYDTVERLVGKYPLASTNLSTLGDIVNFKVDCTLLHTKKWILALDFDCIVFNFPHCGRGIKDEAENIKQNQTLLSKMFKSIRQINTVGVPHVCITLKDQHPYTEWDIKYLAKQHGYECIRSCTFFPNNFPGYEHRRTIGFKEGFSSTNNEELKKCKTFIFAFKVNEQL